MHAAHFCTAPGAPGSAPGAPGETRPVRLEIAGFARSTPDRPAS